MDFMLDNEIAKYKTKKPSSVSKARVRSNHKHTYESCKFRYSETYCIPGKDAKQHIFTDLGTYCTICGKIGDRKMLFNTKDKEEFDAQHPEAPIFNVTGYLDKFVNIVD